MFSRSRISRRRVCVVVASAFVSLLAGCSLVQYKVGEVDYKSPQKAAAIIVGDPQVYSRASLINDRRKEVEYLQRLLDNSSVGADGKSVVSFSPQIIRDLRTIEALSASLGLSFGKTIDNETTASGLAEKIQVTKLEAQLAVLEKQIEGIKSASAPTVTIPAPDLTKSSIEASGETSAGPSVKQPDLTAIQAAIAALQTQLKDLSTVGGVTAPTNNYQGLTDPRDDFTDRQAYRRDIRAAIAEAQLDDEHDTAGNALYRLQFQATVLPRGAQSRQWGATRMEVEAPSLDMVAVKSLYFQWLRYLSDELSRGRRDNATWVSVDPNYEFDRYAMRIGQLGYFDVIDVYRDKSEDQYFCVDHITASDVEIGVDNDGNLTLPINRGEDEEPQSTYEKYGTLAVPPHLFRDALNQSICKTYPIKGSALGSSPLGQPLVAAIHDFGRNSGISPPSTNLSFASVLQNLKTDVVETLDAESTDSQSTAVKGAAAEERKLAEGNRRSAVEQIKEKFDSASTTLTSDISHVPTMFCAAILESTGCPQSKSETAGGGRPGRASYAIKSYSVLPSELVQRLGVTTESTQSLQTALSVAAQLSASASGGLGLGYLKQSDARAEALTRQPLVVGFSGTEDTSLGVGPGYFGWLFGPRFAVKDSKSLDLEQTVRAYGVNADISIPGWWGYVKLNLRSGWVSNWEETQVLRNGGSDPVSLVHKQVRLPVTASTYEALTNFIAAHELMQNSAIFASYVTPDVVPACASTVTFQVGGANIWRADSIYLAGVKAKSITVMPDMKGVAAQFDMNEVFGSLAQSDNALQQVPLSVSATQGTAPPLQIYLVGKRQTVNGVTSCQSPILAPTNYKAVQPMVVSYSPKEICSDTKAFPLVVEGLNVQYEFTAEIPFFHAQPPSNGDYFRQMLRFGRDEKASDISPRTLPVALNVATTTAGQKETKLIALSIAVKDCKAKDASEEEKKAKLITKSVKLAKDQKVTLSLAVPTNYRDIVVSLRKKTQAGNGNWTNASSYSAKTGDKGEVTGTFNLAGFDATDTDELEVQVQINPNPETQGKTIPAESTLKIEKAAPAEAPAAAATPASAGEKK